VGKGEDEKVYGGGRDKKGKKTFIK